MKQVIQLSFVCYVSLFVISCRTENHHPSHELSMAIGWERLYEVYLLQRTKDERLSSLIAELETNLVSFLTDESNSGNPYAQYNLANMYFSGIGTIQNRDIGMEWLNKAANNGNSIAQYAYATELIRSSTMADIDYRPIKDLWTASMKGGYGPAYLALVNYYLFYPVPDHDPARAHAILSEAVQIGVENSKEYQSFLWRISAFEHSD